MRDNNLPYSELTLSEALEVFRRENDLDQKYQGMRAEAQAHYERHDMIHVLFGLDTSMRQEAQADGWTILASDIGWKDVRDFMNLPEEKELIDELGWRSILSAFLKNVPDFVRMAWKSRKMRKKWQWRNNEAYRHMWVDTIRREFGILDALAG